MTVPTEGPTFYGTRWGLLSQGRFTYFSFRYPSWNWHGTRKWMIGILVPFWDGQFSCAMLVLERAFLFCWVFDSLVSPTAGCWRWPTFIGCDLGSWYIFRPEVFEPKALGAWYLHRAPRHVAWTVMGGNTKLAELTGNQSVSTFYIIYDLQCYTWQDTVYYTHVEQDIIMNMKCKTIWYTSIVCVLDTYIHTTSLNLSWLNQMALLRNMFTSRCSPDSCGKLSKLARSYLGW